MIELDAFFDEVFMKFKIRTPAQDCRDQLKYLLGVQFGTRQKECFILVNKLERVLFDLGFIYVNIAKMLKDPEAEAKQMEKLQESRQRYEFVSRGISAVKATAEEKRNESSHGHLQIDSSP